MLFDGERYIPAYLTRNTTEVMPVDWDELHSFVMREYEQKKNR